MHLDTVFTFADRDLAAIHPSTIHPSDRSLVDVVADALGYKQLRLVEAAGDCHANERQQWNRANNAVALEPGVFTYDRNTQTNAALGNAGVEVIPIAAGEVCCGLGDGHYMTCPIIRDSID